MHFQCPKLTPLQSRFAASLLASLVLVVIYFSLTSPHFAYAAELGLDGSGQPRNQHSEDHNWHRIEQDKLLGDEDDEAGKQKHELKRQSGPVALANNTPKNLNGVSGTDLYLFTLATIFGPRGEIGAGLPSELTVDEDVHVKHPELKRRDESRREERQASGSRTVFISINTCSQPTWNGTGTQSAALPQLTLYVSTSSGDKTPGPDSTEAQVSLPLDNGYASTSLVADWDVYLSVHTPDLPAGFGGTWNYDIAASIDAYYHSVSKPTAPFLLLVDTDTTSALLVTDNLTQVDSNTPSYSAWLELSPPPFTLFAANTNNTYIQGIQNSYCGLQNAKIIAASQSDPAGNTTSVQMGMITRGLGSKPKEQFYITQLNRASTYDVMLAMPGNGTASGSGVVGGGGKIWQAINFTTKSDGNCALLFNLSFCDEVAYAVPSNATTSANYAGFASLYDNFAESMYQSFNWSMQQVACNTTSTAQYSLAKNCWDCYAAYKEWICAVSIPRCEDFSADYSWLQPRNMGQSFINNTNLSSLVLDASYTPMSRAPTLPGSPAYQQTYISSLAANSSRNVQIIDQIIAPGPYKEVLPCEDLCYSLVQSCPASMGFGCPYRGRGLEVGYGQRGGDGVQCSYLGAVYLANDGSVVGARVWVTLGVAVGTVLLVLVG